jgi:hypothetical protein
MFGVSPNEQERAGLGHLALVGMVAAVALAIVIVAMLQILAPLDDALGAIERNQRPAFEEEILVLPPEKPQAAAAARVRAPAPADPVEEPRRPLVRGRAPHP